jgi:hypothetical protein
LRQNLFGLLTDPVGGAQFMFGHVDSQRIEEAGLFRSNPILTGRRRVRGHSSAEIPLAAPEVANPTGET